jgi:cyclophilin family peptidyl-prolyl cis-trans isomerase/type II secretory pathway pseudopilin PulG
VGTAKRERQKANRQKRLEELAREARTEQRKRRTLWIVIPIVAFVAILFVAARLANDDDETTVVEGSVPTTVASTDTTAPTASSEPPFDTAVPTTSEAPATTEPAPTTTLPFEFGTAPCPEADGSSELPDEFEGAPELCIDPEATYLAEVVTNQGSFTIELDTTNAPGNVNNFVVLSQWGYYDGTECHRVIRDFAVQCGRPIIDDPANPNAAELRPGYTVNDELPTEPYQEAYVAVANTGQPNTGGGQWFIVVGPDGAALPLQYTVLGKVTEGFTTTVQVLENLADPTAPNGVPPLDQIIIESITITEA